ncbi:MAG: transporter substrate-binding domain-containing protein [Deltaproteobacteria bacterium]|nr:transporter substrate-binding domain-containing protein [Deltaproteobacteria bacterium]
MNRRTLRLALVVALFISCAFAFLPAIGTAKECAITFTDEERAYLAALRETGKITIATRISDHVYFPKEDGTIEGFYYKMAKALAECIGVDLEVRVVKWADYFSKDGNFPSRVRTDRDFVYTPDLIKEVDIYVDAFTLYPWREKILGLIKLFPIKTMAVTRKGEELADIEGLCKRTLAVQPQSTYADTFREIEKKLGTTFAYLEVETFFDGLEAVSEGRADVTCMDSHDAWIVRYENLTLSIPLSDIQHICWMVKKDNVLLSSVIKKFFFYTQESGLFDRYWVEAYKIPFYRYLKIIFLKG